ncbi:uncharacterized protein LOC117491319 [Trematomus bernacchii]|uniref:uncharacterized protein LOC117491319 n=1 Tax=Trematomus bernacchii TaxID=40690 RepID=UPI00146EF4D8|nr:uncharacterized protein LOC117491319 [Trematomus bernacchii]
MVKYIHFNDLICYIVKSLKSVTLFLFFVHHTDHKNLKKSIYVKQSPETKSVQPGDSVTLQCSLLSKNNESADQCPGEHNVYWFRSGSGESHPSIIYTHSEEQKERSCVFSLSKTIHNSSDTGTYYCAVATCGQILFGEGTTVETRTGLRSFGDLQTDDVFLLLPSVVSAISVIVIAILIHAIKKNKCNYCHNKGAVYLQENVAKRNVKRNEDPWIYSTAVFTVMETGPGVYTAAKAF